MYVVRGAMYPKKPTDWEFVNMFTCLLVNSIIFWLGGWKSMGYLVLSTWIGYSFHPAAAHFIQEHYIWLDGQETYSYYGILNWLLLNVGYHNEHHDFLQVPWTSLPKIKKLAPEFYLTMHAHTSYLKVFWEFITQSRLGPRSRIERTSETQRNGRRMISQKYHGNEDKDK